MECSQCRSRRVVAISFLDASAEYVLRALHAEYPLEQVIRIRWADRPRPRVGNPIASFPDRVLRGLERRLYYDGYYARQNRSLDALLAERNDFPDLPGFVEVEMDRLNSPDTAALIKSFAADVLVVCGAPLLKPRIFRAPRQATLNIHYGIAPLYRGEATMFWPLVFGDYDKIGLSIHLIDKGIDTGGILTHVFLPVSSEDNETSLLASASKAIVRPLIEVMERAPLDLLPPHNVDAGRNFRWKDRRIWHDLRAMIRPVFSPRRSKADDVSVVHHWQNGQE
jgi:folate-dependent phosphoribosylglycinamide formyltransferase PurN